MVRLSGGEQTPVGCRLLLALAGLVLGLTVTGSGRDLLDQENLVAWCIVPFDAARRTPEERAGMLRRLYLRKLAYDWREEHVATFEREILACRENDIEFFAFWGEHPEAFALFAKYGLRPQIWKMLEATPEGGTQEERVVGAARGLLPLVEKTRAMGCKLGLYNHGGWSGEPENLVAIVEWLRAHTAAEHVGIVYNLHHGHEHLPRLAAVLALMKPYLWCLNLNGMQAGGEPKILPIGSGPEDPGWGRILLESGYEGPLGILDHRPEMDAEEALRQNLVGLRSLEARLRGAPGQPVVLARNLYRYHPLHLDARGHILPWYSPDPGEAYDFVIRKTWEFWINMRSDANGLPYYMNHQVWRPDWNDRRGLGGDQFNMALSSWQLLYQYTGDERVKENMKFIADYYLAHALSPPGAAWPNLPYPYNTLVYSGVYDGDMILGRGYTQPDKAGSFAWELVKLYRMTGQKVYLDSAVAIADTLAARVRTGNGEQSPWPFKVNALTGEVGTLRDWQSHEITGFSDYTANYADTLELFLELQRLEAGQGELYAEAFDRVLAWMKAWPMKTQKWGPFFEDISGWSDTQVNAVKFATFILENRGYFPHWQEDVKGIFAWVYDHLKDERWLGYGVTVIREQTAYEVPGNSHTARQAAAELLYAKLSGDRSRFDHAVRQLSWATYMVDTDGKNCYPEDEIWLTDGYGDYIRHYLRAMAAAPELAPAGQDHILSSTTILSQVDYAPDLNKFLVVEVPRDLRERVLLFYRTAEGASTEEIRLAGKPGAVLREHRPLPELSAGADSWSWQPLAGGGGLLTIRHQTGQRFMVIRAEAAR